MAKIKIKKEKTKEEFECVDKECSFKVRKELESPEEKVEDLKKAIKDLGYKVEETEEGIRITE